MIRSLIDFLEGARAIIHGVVHGESPPEVKREDPKEEALRIADRAGIGGN